MQGGYRLLDSGGFKKLEQIGPWRIERPSAQAVWRPALPEREWQQAVARFQRSAGGDGEWKFRQGSVKIDEKIAIENVGSMVIRLTDFGHLGIFPEQHANWQMLVPYVRSLTAGGTREIRVLNMFAYTGGSTLACARGGAQVVHLDASKTSVSWARENAEASGLGQAPVRWIVDDVQKFVAREARRGVTYHGIILDPPSYGRGPKGEIWKIETMLPPLLDSLRAVMADDFEFLLLSAHSEGYTPLALENLARETFPKAVVKSGEMVVIDGSGRPLPSGASCFASRTGP